MAFQILTAKIVLEFKEARMKTSVISFLHNQSAATSIEYAVIASGIAAIVVAGVNKLGSTVQLTWMSVSTALK
jgi:pilus assembly protein Flp/PilA